MTFLNKALVSVLLASTIGVTICMDSDNIVHTHCLEIKRKLDDSHPHEAKREGELLTQLVEKDGGEVLSISGQYVRALLPNNSKLINTFEQLKYEGTVATRIPKYQQSKYRLYLKPNKQGMDHTTLKKLIDFAGGSSISISPNSEISTDLPDQSNLGGNRFIGKAVQQLGYTVLSCDEIRDELFYVDSDSSSYISRFLSFMFNCATPSEEFLARNGYSSLAEYYQEQKDERAEHYFDSQQDDDNDW